MNHSTRPPNQHLLRIGYRLRYHWRKFCHFIGLCPRCFSSLNYTRHGKPLCPRCGK